jgi:hypothetical protein
VTRRHVQRDVLHRHTAAKFVRERALARVCLCVCHIHVCTDFDTCVCLMYIHVYTVVNIQRERAPADECHLNSLVTQVHA